MEALHTTGAQAVNNEHLSPELLKIVTFYTLASLYNFSLLFSIHFLWHCKENLFNNQELRDFVFISFFLLILMFDSGVILLGEVQCLSILGVKGFHVILPFSCLELCYNIL